MLKKIFAVSQGYSCNPLRANAEKIQLDPLNIRKFPELEHDYCPEHHLLKWHIIFSINSCQPRRNAKEVLLKPHHYFE